MRLIAAHQGKIVTVNDTQWAAKYRAVHTGLDALDAVLPPGGLARGAVHELLHRECDPPPGLVSLLFSRSMREVGGLRLEARNPTSNLKPQTSPCIIWIDPACTLYPPAVFQAGVDPRDLWIVHPRDAAENLWATAEALRCRGVTATIASPPRLSRTDVRRLQLAAERGGGIGIFMRPLDRHAGIYAAATRWLVQPARGERTIQRWKLTLLHGHGGQIGSSLLLEHRRETNTLHTTVELGDRSRIKTVLSA